MRKETTRVKTYAQLNAERMDRAISNRIYKYVYYSILRSGIFRRAEALALLASYPKPDRVIVINRARAAGDNREMSLS